MTAVTLTPREAIARHLAGQLPGTALARQLLNFGGWMAAAELGPDEQPRLVCHTDARGQRYMQLFSDPQAVQDHVRLSGKERLADLVVKVLGRAAFSTLPPDLDWLDINPLSPPEVHYGREQLAELSRLARAVEIEEVLADLPAAAEPFAQIKRYDQYTLVVSGDGDGTSLVLAPDSKGRQLAAVFTAEDTLETFLTEAVAALGIRPRVLAFDGERLCAVLRRLRLDGLVFNCKGPVPPRAFTMEFLDHILAA